MNNDKGIVPAAVHILLNPACAFAAWVLWFGEVRWVKGWEGLGWLSGFNWSALPICALITGSVAFGLPRGIRHSRRVLFSVAIFPLMFAGFLTLRWAAFTLFSRWPSESDAREALLVLAVAGVVFSLGLVLAASRWLAPLRAWTVLLVLAALVLAFPLSFLTILLLPAINGSTNQIHAFKMGYPVFWLAWLVPLAARSGIQKLPPTSLLGSTGRPEDRN